MYLRLDYLNLENNNFSIPALLIFLREECDQKFKQFVEKRKLCDQNLREVITDHIEKEMKKKTYFDVIENKSPALKDEE